MVIEGVTESAATGFLAAELAIMYLSSVSETRGQDEMAILSTAREDDTVQKSSVMIASSLEQGICYLGGLCGQ